MFPEDDEQREALAQGCQDCVQAIKDAKGRRIVTLPDWRLYAPSWAVGGDVRARFWQAGFVKWWNFFAAQQGWQQFRLIFPLPGYQRETPDTHP